MALVLDWFHRLADGQHMAEHRVAIEHMAEHRVAMEHMAEHRVAMEHMAEHRMAEHHRLAFATLELPVAGS